MATLQRFVLRITQLVELIFGAASAFFMAVLMVMTVGDVVGRNFFNSPFLGAVELTELLLSLVIFLMLPQVTLRNQHIVITLLDARFGSWLELSQRLFNSMLGTAIYAITAWQLWILAGRAAGYGDVTPALELPLSPFLYIMSVLSALNAVAFVLSAATPVSDTEVSVG